MEIAPHLHVITSAHPNVYLVVEPGGLTLIDTSLPFSAARVLAYIRSLGFQPGDLKRILITHADIDHTGGLAALRAATGAAAAASQPEAEAIRAGTSSRKVGHRGIFGFLLRAISPFNLARPSPVDQILTPGQTLPVLGGMQVLSTPGHTPGHISLWCPGPQILFAGDSLVTRSGSFQVYQNWNVWRPDLAVESFRSQAQLHPALICAGHGWTDQDIEGKFARALAVEASNHGSRQ